MENIKVGFDLDRVVFDTNAYMKSVDDKLKEKGTSLHEIFSGNYGRKDIGVLTEELSKRIGNKDTKSILFDDLKKFTDKKLKGIAEFILASGGKIFIITVGDKHQGHKVNDFPYGKIFTVSGDFDKIEKAVSLKLDLFIDDKAQVVEELRGRGINAYQATWYLDEEHKKNLLDDSIPNQDMIGPIIVKLLNE